MYIIFKFVEVMCVGLCMGIKNRFRSIKVYMKVYTSINKEVLFRFLLIMSKFLEV